MFACLSHSGKIFPDGRGSSFPLMKKSQEIKAACGNIFLINTNRHWQARSNEAIRGCVLCEARGVPPGGWRGMFFFLDEKEP
jgi:hypothetical protein